MEIESKMRDEDILVRLDSKNMFDHLISAIFEKLDAKSISNSENVSSEWSDIIGMNEKLHNLTSGQLPVECPGSISF